MNPCLLDVNCYINQQVNTAVLKFPSHIITVPDYSFYGCQALTNLDDIIEGKQHIGEYAFSGCTSLTELLLPFSVSTIGEDAFNFCTSLQNISIPSSVVSIGAGAFSQCTNLDEISIPGSISTIPDRCFSGCTSLKKVWLTNSVTTIGSSAFSWCTALENIYLPNSIKTFGEGAFENCISLNSVTIPDGVVTIPDNMLHSGNDGSPENIIKTNYPAIPGQKRSRCRSNRGIIDSPTPLFTPFCRFRYRSRGQIYSHQYPRTSSTNDPFLKWFSYASRMMRIAMSTSPF